MNNWSYYFALWCAQDIMKNYDCFLVFVQSSDFLTIFFDFEFLIGMLCRRWFDDYMNISTG